MRSRGITYSLCTERLMQMLVNKPKKSIYNPQRRSIATFSEPKSSCTPSRSFLIIAWPIRPPIEHPIILRALKQLGSPCGYFLLDSRERWERYLEHASWVSVSRCSSYFEGLQSLERL